MGFGKESLQSYILVKEENICTKLFGKFVVRDTDLKILVWKVAGRLSVEACQVKFLWWICLSRPKGSFLVLGVLVLWRSSIWGWFQEHRVLLGRLPRAFGSLCTQLFAVLRRGRISLQSSVLGPVMLSAWSVWESGS